MNRGILAFFILCVTLTYGDEDSSLTFDYDLKWFEDNRTDAHTYKARTKISEGLKHTHTIEVIQKINVLRKLDLTFASGLRSLTLSRLEITDIQPGALNLPNSTANLTITFNKINTINEGIFYNLSVVNLNLSSNQIQVIKPNAFDHMPNLTVLALDNNEIVGYNFEFLECPKLSIISLRYNFIEELTKSIFKNLKGNLLTVKLSYNKIRTIHELAFDIKEFKEVELDHNELYDAKLLIKLTKAEKVDLSENHIDCLPKEFMENGLSKIKVLNLTSNPLNCSCLNDLKKKVRKNVEFQKMSPLVKNIEIILPDRECSKN